jgi:hypothetical protein
VGDSISPATGRFVTIDLDTGHRVRYLHLSRRIVGVGGRVTRGQVVGYSGASGYGEEDWSWNVAETGGAHVHMTLWGRHAYSFGMNATLDPADYFDSPSLAGTDARPLEEDMPLTDADVQTLLEGKFELVPGDPSSSRSIVGALRAIFTETAAIIHRSDDTRTQISDVATAVWDYRLPHPLLPKTGDGQQVTVPAGSFLASEPAEHANTRAAIARTATGDIELDALANEIAAKFPQLDVYAIAVAAADEADRRDRERLGKG